MNSLKNNDCHKYQKEKYTQQSFFSEFRVAWFSKYKYRMSYLTQKASPLNGSGWGKKDENADAVIQLGKQLHEYRNLSLDKPSQLEKVG